MNREYVLQERDFLIFQTDAQEKILFANEDYCRISGYGLNELIGKPLRRLFHSDIPESVYNNLLETAQKGHAWNGCLKKRTKDEEFYWVFAMLFPMTYDSLNTKGYTMCCRKPSPEEIRSAAERYKNLRSHLPLRNNKGSAPHPFQSSISLTQRA